MLNVPNNVPNYELAYEDYKKGLKYKEIAEKYGVQLSTVKSWASRHWKKRKGCNQKEMQPKKVATQKGGQPGNKNAVGNKGGAAPPRNKNAVKHGLFSKYLPTETLEIMEDIKTNGQSVTDIIYDNILMQYAAIIRAQQIMYVKNKSDMTKELKKIKNISVGEKTTAEIEYEIQFAWDKQASYLQAQSRAMQTLTSMIKQFKELTTPDDERRMRLELMEVELKQRKKESEASGESNVVDDWIASIMDKDEAREEGDD